MKLFVLSHMGLGDTLVLAGMLRFIAQHGVQDLVLPIKTQYLKATKHLFRGLSNLTLMPVEGDSQVSPAFGADGQVVGHFMHAGYRIILLGLHSGIGMTAWEALHPDFSHRFYIQAGIDYAVSHSHFVLHRDMTSEQHLYDRVVAKLGKEYIFLHEDVSRGYTIDRSLVPRDIPIFDAHDPEIHSDNLFDYCLVMEKAKEIHFMDSCFGLLADRLLGVTSPMVCHAYARDNTTHPSLYAKNVLMLYKH